MCATALPLARAVSLPQFTGTDHADFVSLGFLAASIYPARFDYVAREPALLNYAKDLIRDEQSPENRSREDPFSAVATFKGELARQYALAADHNRQINKAAGTTAVDRWVGCPRLGPHHSIPGRGDLCALSFRPSREGSCQCRAPGPHPRVARRRAWTSLARVARLAACLRHRPRCKSSLRAGGCCAMRRRAQTNLKGPSVTGNSKPAAGSKPEYSLPPPAPRPAPAPPSMQTFTKGAPAGTLRRDG